MGNRHQRGAIGIMGAITLMMALLFMVLALDAGRLWLEKRSLQKAADLAALESVRFTGCGSTYDDAMTSARRAITANGIDLGTTTLVFQRGTLTNTPTSVVLFSPATEPTDQTGATQVTLTRQIPASILMGGLYNNKVQITAKATSSGGPPITVFTMGASMFNIDNALTQGFNDLFSSILGKNVNLTANALQKLAGSTISLNDLMKATGFSTVDDMLQSNMTIQQALNAYSKAAAAGNVDPAAQDAINQLVALSGTTGLQLKLSDVLQLNAGNKDALINAKINLLDIVSTSIKIGGQSGVDLKVNALNLAGGRLELGSIPKIAIGPGGKDINGNWCTGTSSTNSKLSFTLSSGFLSQIPLIGLIFNVDIKVSINFGVGSTYLQYIQTSANPAKMDITVKTSPVTVSIGNQADTGPGVITVAGLKIQISQTGQSLNVDTPLEIAIDTPVQDHLPAYKTGSGEFQGTLAGILSSVSPTIVVVGLDITGIVRPVIALVNTVVGTILGNTIDPIMRALGVNIGSSNLRIYDLQTVEPVLVL